MLIFSYFSLQEHFVVNKINIAKYKELQKGGEKTGAVIFGKIKKKTVKIRRSKITSYAANYRFKVNNKIYYGAYLFSDPASLKSKNIEILYLKRDPNINSFKSKEQLEILLEQQKNKTFIWSGLISLLAGLLAIGFGVMTFIRNIKAQL